MFSLRIKGPPLRSLSIFRSSSYLWWEICTVSQPSWASPVAPSPLSISPTSHCCTSVNCHFDGQTWKTRWKNPLPLLSLHLRIMKHQVFACQDHVYPPSRKAGYKSQPSLAAVGVCAAAGATRAHSIPGLDSPGASSINTLYYSHPGTTLGLHNARHSHRLRMKTRFLMDSESISFISRLIYALNTCYPICDLFVLAQEALIRRRVRNRSNFHLFWGQGVGVGCVPNTFKFWGVWNGLEKQTWNSMCESDFTTLHDTSVDLVGTLARFQTNGVIWVWKQTNKRTNKQQTPQTGKGLRFFSPIGKLQ